MNEKEAYPDGRTHSERALTKYNVGDIVRVGPAYRMGRMYHHDGHEGVYTVVKEVVMSGGKTFYDLANGEVDQPEDWDLNVHAARLTIVRRAR